MVKRRIKIGDVIQILHAKGVSYAQVTHTHPEYKYVIRVFPETYLLPPPSFEEAVSKEPQFTAFFLAQHAVSQGLVSVVANVQIADQLKPFPTFRSAATGKNGERGSWWLLDEKGSYKLNLR